MRLFIALPVPPEIATTAAGLLPDLPALRRVRPELLHLTLAFLGATPEERLADAVAATTQAAAAHPPFAVTLDRAGRFPESGAPRVVWLGMAEGATEIASLAARLRHALAARDLPFDDKPFRSHLTLARVRPDADRPMARVIASAVAGLRLPPLRFTAEQVTVFESVLSPKGPRYTPRGVAPLGENA